MGIGQRNLEVTLAQVNGLRSDLQSIKRKGLVQLYVSSFANILVVLALTLARFEVALPFRAYPTYLTAFLTLPLTLTVLMWSLWVISSMPPAGRLSRDSMNRVGDEDDDVRSVYAEYEWLRFSTSRAQKIERMIDLSTALNFMSLLLILTLMLVNVRLP